MRNFDKNVFVNCPFDEDFRPLLDALLFTLTYLSFTPRIASESSDSGEARIQKIYRIIAESKYGIHDLSRIESKDKGEFYRMNMPFELGLDIGMTLHRTGRFATKSHLILESEPFRYQAALSDLSNSDIKYHKDDAVRLTRAVRDWFAGNGERVSSASVIWAAFTDFQTVFYDERKAEGFEDNEIYHGPIAEYMSFMKEWINNTSPKK